LAHPVDESQGSFTPDALRCIAGQCCTARRRN